jgi:hypothetical protein
VAHLAVSLGGDGEGGDDGVLSVTYFLRQAHISRVFGGLRGHRTTPKILNYTLNPVK